MLIKPVGLTFHRPGHLTLIPRLKKNDLKYLISEGGKLTLGRKII